MKDYSEYLKKPGVLDFIENSWLNDSKEIHDFHAGVINEVIEKYDVGCIIEIGCGTGNVAKRIKSNEYVGYDLNSECIRLSVKKNNKEKLFQVADIRTFNFDRDDSDRYDYLVFTFGVLKHFGLHEWADIFKTIASMGKYLVFNMPVAEETKDDGTEFHHVWMNVKEIFSHVEMNGFEVLEVIYHGVEPIFICRRKN